eukprot:1826513-Rhodomonas_salina.1
MTLNAESNTLHPIRLSFHPEVATPLSGPGAFLPAASISHERLEGCCYERERESTRESTPRIHPANPHLDRR